MNNTKIISTGLFILWIFIILLFTKWEIYSLQENILQKEELEKKLDLIKQEHKKFDLVDKYFKWVKKDKELEAEFSKEEYLFLRETKKNAEKYTKVLKEDEVLRFFYSQINKLNKWDFPIIINNLSISSPKLNSMKFFESDINLSLSVPNKEKLIEILKFIVSTEEYKFFIKDLSFDTDLKVDWNSDFDITIPLKVLYK